MGSLITLGKGHATEACDIILSLNILGLINTTLQVIIALVSILSTEIYQVFEKMQQI